MTRNSRARAFAAVLIGVIVVGSLLASEGDHRPVNGTIWAANRGSHSIQGFNPDTGAEIQTVAMAPASQPGDLAYAKGKLYVTEEFGTPPAIAIVDPEAGTVIDRIYFPANSRPHHAHASESGNSRTIFARNFLQESASTSARAGVKCGDASP